MYPTDEPVGVGISSVAERALAASPVPLRPAPDPDDPAWRRTTDLCEPASWREIGRHYSAHLHTPHLVPGLLCSLQHYTGKALGLVVAAWCADGTLLDLGHDRWWARIDQTGATLEMSLPGTPASGRDPDPRALIETLRHHVDPLVEACVEAGNVTRRTALGGVAASCAGAFVAAYRTAPAARRHAIETDARTVTGALSDRPLVTMVQCSDPPTLAYDRHTWCLIRLGSDRTECGSCPRLSEVERRTRQRRGRTPVPVGAGRTR